MSLPTLPSNHPQRLVLSHEVHARPPELLRAPLRLSYLAIYGDWSQRARQWEQVTALAARYGVQGPAEDANHYSADFGPFRLKWERHAEFARYKFIVQGSGQPLFGQSALDSVPADWIAGLPGELLVAAHAELLPADALDEDSESLATHYFSGNALVGADVAGGAGCAYTDFHIHGDGFSRFLLVDRSLTPRQAGRTIQRLVEIDTYRVLALLALPVARALLPVLARSERELAEITQSLSEASDAQEQALLERLTALEAEIEGLQSQNNYRFSAAAAYHELVQRRTQELREHRIEGLQTFQEFIERRLVPAMKTCSSTAGRLDALSLRVARVSQLLSTRVDLSRQHQNQALLASMDRRASIQLRLQETVEGLSVAAITYYIVGLIGYLGKGLKALGVPVNAELLMGISIPLVALFIYAGVRRTRKLLERHAD